MEDFEDQMTTAFPEVRLKGYLEMRGADGGSWGNIVRCLRSGSGLAMMRHLKQPKSWSEILPP